jgi:hypothetical protein
LVSHCFEVAVVFCAVIVFVKFFVSICLVAKFDKIVTKLWHWLNFEITIWGGVAPFPRPPNLNSIWVQGEVVTNFGSADTKIYKIVTKLCHHLHFEISSWGVNLGFYAFVFTFLRVFSG